MRVSVFSKHRDSIVMILTFAIAIAYGIGVSWLSSKNSDSEEIIAGLLSQNNGFLNSILQFMPPAQWATAGFGGQLSSLLLFVGVSLLGMAAVVCLVALPGRG